MTKQTAQTRARARIGTATAVAVAVLTAVAGCGADGSDVPVVAPPTTVPSTTVPATTPAAGAAPTAGPPETVYVIVIDNTFRPQDTQAKVGDTVTFTNKGKNDHDVLPQEGTAWGVHSAGFHPGGTYSYVFTEPGVYPFFCSIHGTNLKGMVGTITVSS